MRFLGQTRLYKHILLPTDGSDLASVAVRHGIEFARESGASTTALMVAEPFHSGAAAPGQLAYTRTEYRMLWETYGRTVLGEIATLCAAAGVKCQTLCVEHDHPYKAIIDTAISNGCDLIVMASHGRRGAAALILGSETVKVLTHSTIPVLVHR